MYQIRGLLHDLLWQILIKILKVGEVFSVAGSMALGTAIDLEETSNFHFQKFLKMIQPWGSSLGDGFSPSDSTTCSHLLSTSEC